MARLSQQESIKRFILKSKGLNLEEEAIKQNLTPNEKGRYDSGDLCKGLGLLHEYYEILETQVKIDLQTNQIILTQLKTLKAQGNTVAIVSNSMRTTIQLYVDTLDLDVDFIYSSEDAGYRKDAITFWKSLCKEKNLNPQECIVIGDNPVDDEKVPSQAGFQTQLIKRS